MNSIMGGQGGLRALIGRQPLKLCTRLPCLTAIAVAKLLKVWNCSQSRAQASFGISSVISLKFGHELIFLPLDQTQASVPRSRPQLTGSIK